MPNADLIFVSYAAGRGGNLGKAVNKTDPWGVFAKRFSKPFRTPESRKAFDKMSKEQQDELKAIDGWLIGAPVSDKKRSNATVQPRTLLTLDIDYAKTNLPVLIELGLCGLSGYEFMVHSTRRHTPEKPRLRMFAPFSRPVSPDEYVAVSRIVAELLDPDMEQVDKVSFRRAQMMFKPTASKDGDWFYSWNHGAILNPDVLLNDFKKRVGDWRNVSLLPRAKGEEELRKAADKAENPLTKKGAVGDFCRAYSVPEAIEKFLSDRYAPADDFSTKPRYTYLLGTSTSGAVLEDGGLFLYSHHGSDPCADMLVNAFDLVRIHLFGSQDDPQDKETPIGKRPSFAAMVDFIADDPLFKSQQAQSRYDLVSMFDDVADIDDAETALSPPDEAEDAIDDLVGRQAPKETGTRYKAPKDWFPNALALSKDGQILSTLQNISTVIQYDPRTFKAIAFNELTQSPVLRRSLMSKINLISPIVCDDALYGIQWQDYMDVALRAMLEAENGEGKVGYGLKIPDRDLNASVVLAARRNAFHPIKDYLEATVWDGVCRVDTLLIDYLGCPDTPYHREISKLKLLASVTRVYEPGHKFDYAIIIKGPQGIRKSTFIQSLYNPRWFGELDCKLDDKQQIAETITGKWALELPELSGFHKSDHNAAKAFMRRQHDNVRMAYAKHVSDLPRQCVFWGTTNDERYLKDPTGNRSYWPVSVTVETIDTDKLEAQRDQLWAEALHIYRQARLKTPKPATVPLVLSEAALVEAVGSQTAVSFEPVHEEHAKMIADWADQPVSLKQFLAENDIFDDDRFGERDRIFVVRNVFTREQALKFGLNDRNFASWQNTTGFVRVRERFKSLGWVFELDKDGGVQRFRTNDTRLRYFCRAESLSVSDMHPDVRQGYTVVRNLTLEAVFSDLV